MYAAGWGLPWWLLPAMQETQETRVQFLGWEYPLEEKMAAHSNTFAWRISWTEDPGGLQFMGAWRVGYDWWLSTCCWIFKQLLPHLSPHSSNRPQFCWVITQTENCTNLKYTVMVFNIGVHSCGHYSDYDLEHFQPQNGSCLDFPAGPVIKTLYFQCREFRFHPWTGN